VGDLSLENIENKTSHGEVVGQHAHFFPPLNLIIIKKGK
jgi:hypothetical protein